MAGSRLERIGTIFSRVTGLLQSRAMALEDRPIWYDVYKTFPPVMQPRYDRPAPNTPVRDIFYPEDVIRAKFHKHMGRKLPSMDLVASQSQTPTRKVIDCCNRLQSEQQLGIDEAFNAAVDTLGHEGSVSSALFREKETQSVKHTSIADSFKQVSNKTSTVPQVDVKSIFKDD